MLLDVGMYLGGYTNIHNMCVCINKPNTSFLYVYMYTHMHTYSHTYRCLILSTYQCISIYIYVCMYVCTYVCIHVVAYLHYVYTYIYTQTKEERARERERGRGRGREREYSIAQMLVNCEYDSEWFKGCAGFYRTLEDSVRVV